MAPNDRVERRLMRQRGAGVTSTQGEFNFGGIFKGSAPLVPRRSTRPSPGLSAQRSSRPTPSRLPQQLTARNRRSRTPAEDAATIRLKKSGSAGAAPSIKTPMQRPPRLSQSKQTFATPIVTGKRKRGRPPAVDKENDELEGADDAHQTSSIRKSISTGKQRLSARQTSIDAVDDLAGDDIEHVLSSTKTDRRVRGAVLEGDDELAGQAPPAGPIAGIKMRNSLANLESTSDTPRRRQSVATWLANQSRASPFVSEAPATTKRVNTPRPALQKSTPKDIQRPAARRGRQSAVVPNLAEDDASADEPLPEQPQAERRRAKDTTQQFSDDELSVEDVEDIEDELSPEQAKHERAQTSARKTPTGQDVAMAGGNAPRPRIVPKTVTKKPRLGGATKLSREDSSGAQKSKRDSPKNNNVPITVFRISHPSKVVNDEDDADPLRDPNLKSISGVNAVDVLHQITRELTEKQYDSLSRAYQAESQDRQRAELKRKRIVVSRFKDQLSDQLFDLTEVLDAGAVLKKRLRAALKKRIGLVDELLSVRKQRAELQVRIDDVREQHEADTRNFEHEDKLNSALFDIELAVKRGKERAAELGRDDEGPELPLDMLLTRAARDVSANQMGGGLLHDTQQLNTILEKAAAVLEGRA